MLANPENQEFRTAIPGQIACQHRASEDVESATQFQAEPDSDAISSLASHAMATVGLDPSAAIAWVQTIPDEDLRHEALLKVPRSPEASKDTEALERLRAAGVTDIETSEDNVHGWCFVGERLAEFTPVFRPRLWRKSGKSREITGLGRIHRFSLTSGLSGE